MNAFQQYQERKSIERDHDALRPHLSQEQNEELDVMRREGNVRLRIGYAVFGGVLLLVGFFSFFS